MSLSVEEKVVSYFREIARIENVEIDKNVNLFTTYGIDSVKAVKLISDIEVEYDIDIPDEVAQKISSLNDVITIIQDRIEPE